MQVKLVYYVWLNGESANVKDVLMMALSGGILKLGGEYAGVLFQMQGKKGSKECKVNNA